MKKFTLTLLGAILALGLTACGDKGAAGTNTNQQGETQTEKAITVDELLAKSAEASQKLNSFAMEANINQNITMAQGDQKQEQKIDIAMKADMNKEPFGMYQEMKMSMPGQGEQDIKQYITKVAIYTQVEGKWVKLPDEMNGSMIQALEESAKPEKQLEQFKSIAKDMKVSEDGDKYVMTGDLSGDGLKDLAKSLMSQAGSGEDQQALAMIEKMNIKNIKVTYAVNKDSFLPVQSDIDMVMEMEEGGQKISMDIAMKSSFSKYNEVGEIKVPQEVVDSAQ
ncbi:DUF6612 family protein [Brevibacillus massiliensis]|uniref:DUF6612 family protein n=1 Tax=Brevibacillus massiliensis TaxID=1118054 RepID=UPI00036647FF|nr:DUF6612 family protein [Brevibacillus massiliensis]